MLLSKERPDRFLILSGQKQNVTIMRLCFEITKFLFCRNPSKTHQCCKMNTGDIEKTITENENVTIMLLSINN